MVVTWFCYITFLAAFAFSHHGKLRLAPALRTECRLTAVSLFFALISLHQVLATGGDIIKERYGHDLFLALPHAPTDLEITNDQLERTFNPNYWIHRFFEIGGDAQSLIAAGRIPDVVDRMQKAYAAVSKDKTSLNAAYEKGLSSFDASVREKKRYSSIFTRPASGKPGLWNSMKEYLLYAVSSEHRALRKLDKKGQELSSKASELAETREVFKKYYNFNEVSNTYLKEKNDFEVCMTQKNFASAYRRLIEMANINTEFHAKMATASDNAAKAPWMFFLCNWGMLLFLICSVFLQVGLRILNTQASPYIVPGLILFSGIGWALLFDISLNFASGLRYLALYHGRALLAGYVMMFAVVAILPSLFHKAILPSLEAPGDKRIFYTLTVVSVGFALFSRILPSNILSELLKIWAIILLSWFLAIRGEFIAESIRNMGFDKNRFKDYIRVLAVYFTLVFISLLVSKDMGPFALISLILAAAFIIVVGGLNWIPGLACVTVAVGVPLYLGVKYLNFLHHIEERFKEAWDPFRMGTGHLARLAWFREAAGAWGFGFGNVRWYGYHGNTGVPKQIQSDYSYTALVGAIGSWGAILFILLFMVWLGIIFVDSQSSGKKNLPAQFFSFFGIFSVLLLLFQNLATVAGNLTMAPLTGITMPFISHGFYSYVCSCVLIAVLYGREMVMSQFNGKGY